MTNVMIRQPGYLPNIGFFKKIQSCDLFVYLDDAQFVKDRFDNRNKIRTIDGYRWLTVPVKRPVFSKKINEIDISYDTNWQKEHCDLIFENYHKTKYFSSYWNSIKKIIDKKHEKLIDLNINLIQFINSELKISTEIFSSSDLNISETKTKKLVSICSRVNATCYISGISGRDYLDEQLFSDAKIKLIYENFIHPKYDQLYGNFLENMSVIDLLFNMGEQSVEILSKCKNFD
tara:strand:+ start:438 stop:1133 length:696 start_codon:yes stop_codon:yes gene_type:complete